MAEPVDQTGKEYGIKAEQAQGREAEGRGEQPTSGETDKPNAQDGRGQFWDERRTHRHTDEEADAQHIAAKRRQDAIRHQGDRPEDLQWRC